MFAAKKQFFTLIFVFVFQMVHLFGEPVINHLKPNSGPAAGGMTVRIKGSGFEGATSVNFGIYPATSFVVKSDQLIIAQAPTASIGNQEVIVTAPSGTSTFRTQALFTFQGDRYDYVTNFVPATVSAIDIRTNTIAATIGGEFNKATHVAITPNGKRVYVTSPTSHQVTVIDRTTLEVIATIPVGDTPFNIAINPAGTLALVSNLNSDDVSVIDLFSNTVLTTISVGLFPAGIAISPDGTKAYVVNNGEGSVSVIDLGTYSVVKTITGILYANNIALNPAGTRAYVTRGVAPGLFVEIDTTTDQILGSHPTGGNSPKGIVVNQTGTTAYIANLNSGTISAVNLSTFATTLISTGAGSRPVNLKLTPDGSKAYVTLFNADSVAILDLTTNTLTAPSIPVGQSPVGIDITSDGLEGFVANTVSNNISVINLQTNGVKALRGSFVGPSDIAINPTNTRAYVADQTRLVVIDLATNKVLPPINLPGATAIFSLAISPNGSIAYAVENNAAGLIYAINLDSGIVRNTIPIGMSPVAVAFNPNDRTAYTANAGDKTVSVIDVTSQTVTQTIHLSNSPQFIKVSPDGTRAYLPSLPNQVEVIDLLTNTVLTTIAVGMNPSDIAIAPDQKKAYVANRGDPTLVNSTSISVIDTQANTVIQTLPLMKSPQTISITPDGFRAYVTATDLNDDGNGSILVIDLETLAILETIPVGPQNFIASGNFLVGVIAPDQAPVASFTSQGRRTNHLISFDASASRTAVGAVLTYHWNFGDGQTITSSNSVVNHTYTAAGSYVVTLTVVNSGGTSTTQVFTGQTMTRHGGPSATIQKTIVIKEPKQKHHSSKSCR